MANIKKAKSQAKSDEEILVNIALARQASANGESHVESDAKTQDSFVNYQHNIGVGSDNPLSTATYGFNPITRNRTLLEWMYRGSWLAGKLVDTIADDMTRAGADIIDDIEPDQIKEIEKKIVELKVWDAINNAIKWGRLYGGGLAVVLIDGHKLSDPLDHERIGKGQFKGLMDMDRWMVEPSLNDLITQYGPDLGKPRFYKVTSMAPVFVGMKIHHSRVIRFDGIQLPYWQRVMENLWGLSILERVFDRLISFDSATTGAAQLVYKAYIRNYKIKDLRKIIATGGNALAGLTKMVDMMRRYQGIEGMTLLDGEDEYSSDSHGGFGGLSDILVRFMEQCSGAEQIPLVRLFGQSPSGFSTGDTDLRNYYDTVDQRRQNELLSPMTMIYKIVAKSLGIQVSDGFSIVFRSLWQMTDTEKSSIAAANTSTIIQAEESGLISKPTALRELKQQSKTTNIFSNITEEDIQEAELEPVPEPEMDMFGNGIEGQQPDKAEKIPGVESGIANSEKIPKIEGIKPVKQNDAATIKAAGILCTYGQGSLLLAKRSSSVENPGSWAFPGGKIENGEKAYEAARREFFEEMGVDLADKIGDHWENDAESLKPVDGFLTFVLNGFDIEYDEIKLNSENSTWGWFEVNDLPEPMLPATKQIIENYFGE